MRPKTPQQLRGFATACAAFVVLSILSMPAWASVKSAQQPVEQPARASSGSKTADEVDDGVAEEPAVVLSGPGAEDVRELPLLQPKGLIATTFPNGAGLDDEELVRDAFDALGADAELTPEAMDELWTALPLTTSLIDSSRDYPYSYPALAAFGEQLTDEIVSAHPSELRELGALLVLATTYSPSPSDNFLPVNGGLIGAEVILERVASVDPSCDSQLMRAWAITLGNAPGSDVLAEVWQPAVNACPPDDPTPRWWWGHRLLEDSVSGFQFYSRDDTRTDVLQRPIDFFETWLKITGDPAAQAGLGETLLSQAEAFQLAGVMPFTVRDYSERARTIFESQQGSRPSASGSLAIARAAFVHGDADAGALTSAIAVRDGLPSSVRSTATFILERLHEFDAAAAASSPGEVDPRSLSMVASNRDALLPPTWENAADARVGTYYDASFAEIGGGEVEWLGTIPQYRRQFALTTSSSDMPGCLAHAEALNLVLAGRYAEAREVDASVDIARDDYCQNLIPPAEAAERIELGYSESVSWDDAQNLARYAGDLDLAATMVDSWIAEWETNPLAQQRRGEVSYLMEDWDGAVSAFELAAATPEGETFSEFGETWSTANVREAWLMLGLALEAAGDKNEALGAYDTAVQIGTADATASGGDQSTLAAAHMRAATLLAERGDMRSSLPHRQSAAELAATNDGADSWADRDILDRARPLSSGAEYNNYAVGLLDQERQPQVAKKFAMLAVDLDPMNPVYLETLAQTQEKSGDAVAAEKNYEAATVRDSTTFQSLNNRGVINAQQGNRPEALQSLRAAVAAKPDYATAWFNLGIVLGEGASFGDFAESQASFARAVLLDGNLRGESATLRSDTSAFQTDLDVSRSIAPEWTVAGAARSTTQSIGWILALLAMMRLLFALGLDKAIELATGRVLAPRKAGEGLASRAWLSLDRPTGVVMAVLATGAIAAWPLLGASTSGLVTVLVTLVVAFSVTFLFVVAAGGQRRGWVPSMLVGASTAAFGYSLVPAPVDARPTTTIRERWGGSIIVGVLAIAALSLAYATGMPSVRWVGLVALGLLTTSLLPLRPFDGAQPMPRPVSVVVGLLLLVVTGGVAMAWW